MKRTRTRKRNNGGKGKGKLRTGMEKKKDKGGGKGNKGGAKGGNSTYLIWWGDHKILLGRKMGQNSLCQQWNVKGVCNEGNNCSKIHKCAVVIQKNPLRVCGQPHPSSSRKGKTIKAD